MRRPGRKSAESLSVVQVDVGQQRPLPPPELPADEQSIWLDLVQRYRAGWFDGSEVVLRSFVGLVATERFLATEIARLRARDPFDYAKLASLVATQKLVVMGVGNLGTKLRVTPRSSFDRYAPKVVSTLPKPWDLTPPDDEPPPG